MQMIINRFKEPSSWASIAAVLALFGVNVSNELIQLVMQGGVALSGLLGFLMRDPGSNG